MDFLHNIVNSINISHFTFAQIDANPLQKIIVLIALILITSFLVDFFLINSFLGKSYRVFVAPGIIVHELSHALFCILTGASIKKISLFEKKGGYVQHTQPRIPILGQFLISFAPFVIGLGSIYLLIRYAGMPNVDFSLVNLNWYNYLDTAIHFLRTININGLYALAAVYLVFSIVVTMTPSWQDLANAISAIIILILIGLLASKYLHYSVNLGIVSQPVLIVLATVLFLLILLLLLSIIIYTLSFLIRR